MADDPGPKKVGKFIELPADLVDALTDMAKRHGRTFTAEVTDGLRRHVKYPPALEPEPLPDSPAVKNRKK